MLCQCGRNIVGQTLPTLSLLDVTRCVRLRTLLDVVANVRSCWLKNYPGYQRFFLVCDGELRFVGRRPTRVRPKAEDTSGEARVTF